MIGAVGPCRSRLYSAPVAPGSYYESRRVRQGHFLGLQRVEMGHKHTPEGRGLR